jgi:hypothetical protein
LFNAWHPPVMAWLLGLADKIIPGAPLIIAVQAGLFFAGLAALAAAARPGWGAAVLTGLVAASPIVLVYQGLVVTDVLFADAALAGFAALALAARSWDRPRARTLFIALSMLAFILATLARQNGVLASAAGALALGAIAAGKAPPGRRLGALAFAGLVSATIIGLTAAAGGAWFAAHGDHRPEKARQWSVLALFDLAGAARRDPALPLPLLHAADPPLEAFVRRDATRVYDPNGVDSLASAARFDRFMERPSPLVTAQWRAMLTASPGDYLATRADVFRRMFAPPDIEACAPILVGVDPGDPVLLRDAGLSARETDKDDWDADYADQAVHSPIFSHPAYALLAVILLAWAGWDVRRGARPELIATVGLLASALVFTASFTVISLGCDFRYLYFLDVAAMAGAVQRAGMLRLPFRRRRRAG